MIDDGLCYQCAKTKWHSGPHMGSAEVQKRVKRMNEIDLLRKELDKEYKMLQKELN